MRENFNSSNEKTRTSCSNAAGSGLFPSFRGVRGVKSCTKGSSSPEKREFEIPFVRLNFRKEVK